MPREGAASLESQRLKPAACDWKMAVLHLWENVTKQVGEGGSAEPWVWRSVFADDMWARRVTRRNWRQASGDNESIRSVFAGSREIRI